MSKAATTSPQLSGAASTESDLAGRERERKRESERGGEREARERHQVTSPSRSTLQLSGAASTESDLA